MRRVLCLVLLIALGDAAVRYPRTFEAEGGLQYGNENFKQKAEIGFGYEFQILHGFPLGSSDPSVDIIAEDVIQESKHIQGPSTDRNTEADPDQLISEKENLKNSDVFPKKEDKGRIVSDVGYNNGVKSIDNKDSITLSSFSTINSDQNDVRYFKQIDDIKMSKNILNESNVRENHENVKVNDYNIVTKSYNLNNNDNSSGNSDHNSFIINTDLSFVTTEHENKDIIKINGDSDGVQNSDVKNDNNDNVINSTFKDSTSEEVKSIFPIGSTPVYNPSKVGESGFPSIIEHNNSAKEYPGDTTESSFSTDLLHISGIKIKDNYDSMIPSYSLTSPDRSDAMQNDFSNDAVHSSNTKYNIFTQNALNILAKFHGHSNPIEITSEGNSNIDENKNNSSNDTVHSRYVNSDDSDNFYIKSVLNSITKSHDHNDTIDISASDDYSNKNDVKSSDSNSSIAQTLLGDTTTGSVYNGVIDGITSNEAVHSSNIKSDYSNNILINTALNILSKLYGHSAPIESGFSGNSVHRDDIDISDNSNSNIKILLSDSKREHDANVLIKSNSPSSAIQNNDVKNFDTNNYFIKIALSLITKSNGHSNETQSNSSNDTLSSSNIQSDDSYNFFTNSALGFLPSSRDQAGHIVLSSNSDTVYKSEVNSNDNSVPLTPTLLDNFRPGYYNNGGIENNSFNSAVQGSDIKKNDTNIFFIQAALNLLSKFHSNPMKISSTGDSRYSENAKISDSNNSNVKDLSGDPIISSSKNAIHIGNNDNSGSVFTRPLSSYPTTVHSSGVVLKTNENDYIIEVPSGESKVESKHVTINKNIYTSNPGYISGVEKSDFKSNHSNNDYENGSIYKSLSSNNSNDNDNLKISDIRFNNMQSDISNNIKTTSTVLNETTKLNMNLFDTIINEQLSTIDKITPNLTEADNIKDIFSGIENITSGHIGKFSEENYDSRKDAVSKLIDAVSEGINAEHHFDSVNYFTHEQDHVNSSKSSNDKDNKNNTHGIHLLNDKKGENYDHTHDKAHADCEETSVSSGQSQTSEIPEYNHNYGDENDKSDESSEDSESEESSEESAESSEESSEESTEIKERSKHGYHHGHDEEYDSSEESSERKRFSKQRYPHHKKNHTISKDSIVKEEKSDTKLKEGIKISNVERRIRRSNSFKNRDHQYNYRKSSEESSESRETSKHEYGHNDEDSDSEERNTSWKKGNVKNTGRIKSSPRIKRQFGGRYYGNRGYHYNSGESYENSNESGEREYSVYIRPGGGFKGGHSSEESHERY